MRDDTDRTLPSGWSWATLKEIVTNHDGARVPLKKDDRAKRQGKYPYYGASGVIDQIDDYLFDGAYLLIGEDGANLLARSKPIAFQAHGQFWVNNHAHILTPVGGSPLGYLESYFNSIDLARYVTGTAQPKLTQAHLNKIPVPVAPLHEQHRIVENVETHLSKLDDAVASLERVRANLKRYRASILKSAVEGRLVPTEAELEKMKAKGKPPKDDKWKAKYKEPVKPDTKGLPELPEGWCWGSVHQLTWQVKDGPHFSPKYSDEGVPFISGGNVRPDGDDPNDDPNHPCGSPNGQ